MLDEDWIVRDEHARTEAEVAERNAMNALFFVIALAVTAIVGFAIVLR
jgi:hypothetical protein